MTDRCSIAGCQADPALDYLGHGLCDLHWNAFTAEGVPPEKLRMVLGVDGDAPTASEDTMAKKKNGTKTASAAKAATPAKAKAAKPATAQPAPAKPATPKPKKERPPKEDLVVFAFRLTQAERDAIHKTAGPRNATQFVRRVATAFAAEDETAFRTVVKEARESRA